MSTNTDQTYHLHILNKDLNLPSCDPECIAVMTYLRMLKIKPKTYYTSLLPFKSNHNCCVLHITDITFPKLIQGDNEVIGAKNIFAYLKSKPFSNLDINLTDKQRAQVDAVSSLLHEQFLPCLVRNFGKIVNLD